MNETSDSHSQPTPQRTGERQTVGNLTDFVYKTDDADELEIEVAVKEDGKVAIFHNMPFKNDLSWLEFDLSTNMLNFILDDGDTRDTGISLYPQIAKNMQNSHQVLMILLDNNTGDAKEGYYIPLIIHQK